MNTRDTTPPSAPTPVPASRPRHAGFRRFGPPALGVLAVAVAVVVAVSWGKTLDERHRPLAFDESFDFAGGSFADYLAYAQRRLRAAHPEADDATIANLAPFRLEPREGCPPGTDTPYPNGVLLTHDLLETPYGMRSIGAYLAERCMLVYGLLLPGHGTRPGDLLEAGSADWIAAEDFATRELAREAQNLYLGGHGIGGTLSILEAAGNADIDGLILFAPEMSTRPAAGGRWLAPLGKLIPAARWAEVVPPFSTYYYDSRPWRSDDEVDRLVETMQAALPTRPFEVPVLTIVSAADATVSVPDVLAYAAERVHPLSVTLVYGQDYLPEPVSWLQPFPELADMGLSHRGLMVPPYDPEFGENGSSRDCGHYFRRDDEAYKRCMAMERTLLGEVNADNLAAGLLERAAYNPDYHGELTRQVENFVYPATGLRRRSAR